MKRQQWYQEQLQSMRKPETRPQQGMKRRLQAQLELQKATRAATATMNEKAAAGTTRNAENGAITAKRNGKATVAGGTSQNSEIGTTQSMNEKATVTGPTPNAETWKNDCKKNCKENQKC